MDAARVKSLYLILFSFLLVFDTSLSFARNNDRITLSNEIISSAENCPNTEKNSVQLNCKSYHQTTNYTCGPAAVMTLLRYYGKLSNKDMNRTTELRIAGEMGAAANGTTSGQVSSWLSNHGFRVNSGQRISTDRLIENIKKGIPTIIAFSNHWILAKGYKKGSTPNEDEIIFADSCCNVSIMSRDTIDSMWGESQMASNHCSNNVGTFIEATPER